MGKKKKKWANATLYLRCCVRIRLFLNPIHDFMESRFGKLSLTFFFFFYSQRWVCRRPMSNVCRGLYGLMFIESRVLFLLFATYFVKVRIRRLLFFSLSEAYINSSARSIVAFRGLETEKIIKKEKEKALVRHLRRTQTAVGKLMHFMIDH